MKMTAFFAALILCVVGCSVKKNKNHAEENKSAVTALHVKREAVAVWLDATRSDIKVALDSLDAHRNNIGTVKPVLYALLDGKVILHEKIGVNTKDDIVFTARKREPKIAVEVVFGNVNMQGAQVGEVVKMLENPLLRQLALDTISKIASDPDFTGVDLDWEGVPWDEASLFAGFVEDLALRVHDLKKSLSVVMEWSAQTGVAAKRIGKAADRVELVNYPEHHAETDPGPMASIESSSANLKYFLQVIPRAKIIYCMPLFGYQWIKWPGGPEKYAVDDFTWKKWQELKHGSDLEKLASLREKRDREGNPFATFIHYRAWSSLGEGSNPVDGVAYYEDAVSISRKIAMAKEMRIGQFGFWQIGGEDPAIWKSLN
jgi:spore germination protein YaaH